LNINNINAYELIEERYIKDLDSKSYLLRHKKSGARVAVLENDDANKVFYIGFRTPPADSTGVAHILEHSVLCGSEKYPSKDPFVELAKGSLNTFLNAMTYPDKTVYPVASCNDKDFKNLMDIYLDAVFHPNIYNEKKIFMQEGWHYELEDVDSELKINGVVYNEMKGAFSSPDDVLSREIMNSLYPDTAYGVESGGDPDVIPELTYENFIKFHQSYYHPCNSYVYLYGDCDMNERLDYLDKEYLSNYEKIEIDSFPGVQKPFEQMKVVEKEYPITEDESLDNSTYLSYNCVLGDNNMDRELYIAFQIIDYALVSSQGTPLKKALLDAGVGNDIYAVFENGICQPYYSIVAKNANEADKEKFLQIIKDVLNKVVEEGFDKNALEAGLTGLEFKYRESDFGTNPRGLFLGLYAFDSWLYDENKPFIHIECNETYAKLREYINTDYYEELVKKYLIGNNHSSAVFVKPVKGLTAKKEAELADKLAKMKAGLSEDEVKAIVDNTKALLEYQETPDSEEVLKKIPRLKREDLDKLTKPLDNELINHDGTDILFHEEFTNGISYVSLLFDTKGIPAEYIPYLGLIQYVLGSVDTENYDYETLGYEMDKKAGSLYSVVSCYGDASDSSIYKPYTLIKTKFFNKNIKDVFALITEIIESSKLNDIKRVGEIVGEIKSHMQSRFISSGHHTASIRAVAGLSEGGAYNEALCGITFYRFMENAEKIFASDDDTKKLEFTATFEKLIKYIFRADKLFVDFTGEKETLDALKSEIDAIKPKLYKEDIVLTGDFIKVNTNNEAFTSSATVNYVCKAGNFKKAGLKYSGAFRVLKTIMGYEYLWSEVRVKGGAYGCMSAYARTGDCFFVSYRDPNLDRTLDVYSKATDFIRKFKADEEGMTKYIIGTMSEMDIPLTPRIKGERSFVSYMTGVTYEMLQQERDEVLSLKDEDIRKLAEHIEAVLNNGVICVVGNEETINASKDKFDKVEPLFN